MSISEIATVVIAVCAVIASIVAIRQSNKITLQNGKRKIEEYTELKKDVQSVKDELNDKNYGLRALHDKVGDHLKHCARMTGEFSIRLTHLEKDK